MSDDELSIVNEDDDLTIVEESGSQEEGFKLQADGQYGLRFEPKSNGIETYSLSSAPVVSDESVPSANAQHGSATDAPTIAAPSQSDSTPDVYGLAEPEPTPNVVTDVSELKRQRLDSKKKKKQKKSKTDDDSFENNSYSVDELYDRKRREREEEGEPTFENGKRPELPPRPFWDDVFKPFLSLRFLFHIGLVSCAAFVPLFLATLFFSRFLSADVQTMLQNHQGLSALTAFMSCIWKDKIIFLLFCFVWGVFSVPYSFHIFNETANGADEIDEWPEYSFVGGAGQFLWIMTLIALAGIPGAFLFSLLGLHSIVGFALTATCLTPIFFLSCMQADALFALITKDVFHSLKNVAKSWLYFFGIAYAFLFGTIGLSLASIGYAVHKYVMPNVGGKPSVGCVALVALVLSLVFSFIPALYLRFLGRLAWIVEDDIRKRVEQEEANEQEEFEEETEDERQ